ncbi:hypothetical protein LY28_01326 [Ruminiclostridium sufflavum DSM 19573]|uniref:Uncharacterized protein n=1 Tax=Ruminiclostridium sufflavum DSM 19573 TaxID=1121337 RepID=A0A318XM18_9FIRM|nr:hypothetical protein [Ruminiclostridium sufflavum]PYG88477.1 hypothetical protein LY28_01326 [Ruminiclostridium sufflavum DSM 19573]
MSLISRIEPLFIIGIDLSYTPDHTAYFAICNDCGKTWNVSRYKRGYICPYCTSKKQRERKTRHVRKVGR